MAELKHDAPNIFGRMDNQDYMNGFLEPKLPVAKVTVAAPSNNTSATAVEDDPATPVQPSKPTNNAAAASKQAGPADPAGAPVPFLYRAAVVLSPLLFHPRKVLGRC